MRVACFRFSKGWPSGLLLFLVLLFFFLPEEEKKYIPVKEEKKHIPVKNTSSRQKKNRLLAEAVMQQ